jgi:ABC-type antimicrobial peptide transport system permease subunit
MDDLLKYVFGLAIAVITFFLREFHSDVKELKKRNNEQEIRITGLESAIGNMKDNISNNLNQLESKMEIKLDNLTKSLERIEHFFFNKSTRKDS